MTSAYVRDAHGNGVAQFMPKGQVIILCDDGVCAHDRVVAD